MRDKIPRRHVLAAGALAALGMGGALAAYPEKVIRIVVPFPAGGTGDVFVRTVSQKLGERLGQAVIIDNRPGASTLIGSEAVAQAQPDGYTLLATSSSLATLPVVSKKMPFDVVKDLRPVLKAVQLPVVLATVPDAPFSTVRELVSYARANPGKVAIGVSPGQASVSRLAMELFKQQSGVDILIVPYAGSAPVTTALLGKQILCLVDAIPASAPFIKAGRMRGLAVLTSRRTTGLPDIPTIGEAGMPGLEIDTWFGILAPAGTPDAIVKQLNTELLAVMAIPEVRAKVLSLGMEPTPGTPADFASVIAKGVATWTAVARSANLVFE